jgi:hypothetical protein
MVDVFQTALAVAMMEPWAPVSGLLIGGALAGNRREAEDYPGGAWGVLALCTALTPIMIWLSRYFLGMYSGEAVLAMGIGDLVLTYGYQVVITAIAAAVAFVVSCLFLAVAARLRSGRRN